MLDGNTPDRTRHYHSGNSQNTVGQLDELIFASILKWLGQSLAKCLLGRSYVEG